MKARTFRGRTEKIVIANIRFVFKSLCIVSMKFFTDIFIYFTLLYLFSLTSLCLALATMDFFFILLININLCVYFMDVPGKFIVRLDGDTYITADLRGLYLNDLYYLSLFIVPD